MRGNRVSWGVLGKKTVGSSGSYGNSTERIARESDTNQNFHVYMYFTVEYSMLDYMLQHLIG